MSPIRYWYDCEFLEDGKTIDLISIGIVSEDGRTYYAISADYDQEKAEAHPFVSRYVLPYLGPNEPISRDVMRAEVSEFLRSPTGSAETQLWAWQGASDHVALAQLFGTMSDLPDHIPMFTNDLKQEWTRRHRPFTPPQIEGNHNALADAKHVAFTHQFLEA